MNPTFRYIPQHTDILNTTKILESSGFFLPHEIPAAIDLLKDRLQKEDKSAYQFIFAEIENKPVAYICYGLMSCSITSYSVYFLAVHEQYRALRIGKKLLSMVENKVKKLGGKNIFLETASKPLYEPTRKFYLNLNYKIEAVLKDFYDINDDKIIFSKRF